MRAATHNPPISHTYFAESRSSNTEVMVRIPLVQQFGGMWLPLLALFFAEVFTPNGAKWFCWILAASQRHVIQNTFVDFELNIS
jgi:hypothetical protein